MFCLLLVKYTTTFMTSHPCQENFIISNAVPVYVEFLDTWDQTIIALKNC